MERFRAVVITRDEATKRQRPAEFRELGLDDLMEGDVVVAVGHSTVNYKDGLAMTGQAPVVRRFPMIPGVDLSGTVVASAAPDWQPGDAVVVNGWGLGETHMGGYAGRARLRSEWLIQRPAGFSGAEAMAIGTAGYTAMLCVLALDRAGVVPESGPVVVTGAAGGVGSVAVALLARRGYSVVASTGRPEESSYLTGLGAREVIDRAELSGPGKPLAKERWAGAIDTVGSHTLANVLASTRYGGAVAACGLAGGMDLPATVAPFILRGVALLGVDSVMVPRPARIAAWAALDAELDRDLLARMTTRISFDDVIAAGPEILAGKVRGRIVVDVGG
jgi:acrylyl-CoA reductase (NADPH)